MEKRRVRHLGEIRCVGRIHPRRLRRDRGRRASSYHAVDRHRNQLPDHGARPLPVGQRLQDHCGGRTVHTQATAACPGPRRNANHGRYLAALDEPPASRLTGACCSTQQRRLAAHWTLPLGDWRRLKRHARHGRHDRDGRATVLRGADRCERPRHRAAAASARPFRKPHLERGLP